MAAKTVEASHPSWLAMRAPPENPVAKTRFRSMQYFCSRVVTSCSMNETSLGAVEGTGAPPKRGWPGTFHS